MSFWLLKYVHVSCALVSYLLFVLRGVWRLQGSPRLRVRWVRVLPHIVDSLLLASAIGLAVTTRQYPVAFPWLSAKVLALLLYIGLGTMALRFARERRAVLRYWVLAQLTFAYIVWTAWTRRWFFF